MILAAAAEELRAELEEGCSCPTPPPRETMEG